MKKRKWCITDSTKLTMIFCGCIVVFSAILLIFLIFFPLKMENPSNGINEKLIASAKTTTDIAATDITTTTVSSYINTRKTTEKNHVPVTIFTETINDFDDDYSYQDYNDNYYNYGYNDYDTPSYTQAPDVVEPPVVEPGSVIPDVSNVPDVLETE